MCRQQPRLNSLFPGMLLLALVTPVAAQSADILPETPATAEDCAGIENGVSRLACYDALFKAGSQPVTTGSRKAETGEPVDTAEDNRDMDIMEQVVNRYMAKEKALFSFSGSFLGHRPTYILPITWVDQPNLRPYSPSQRAIGYDYHLENEEAKYQISFKIPLLSGVLDDRTTLWFGYTQQSLWQVYNQDESAPFRETNYEPEIFFRYHADWKLGKMTINGFAFGFNHQSNGQSDPRSRSWNRLMGTVAFSRGRWLFMVNPWYRLPENKNDDNPDIESYLGYASYRVIYKAAAERTFSMQLMNNLRSDNRTTVELGYSFPLGRTLKGFIQYYNGYGESLIDYNHRIKRFGVGIMLNDWL